MGDSEEKKLREEVLKIYTPLSVAKEEIWKRWNDKELRKRVEEYLGDGTPAFLKEMPRGIIARYIATPDFEFKRFIELSELASLNPVCLEYNQDKFVAQNSDKYPLCKMFFYEKEKRGKEKITHVSIVNFNKFEGERFSEIKTIFGEKIVEFHHNLFDFCADSKYKDCFFDMSYWIKQNGKKPQLFYEKFIALFICHGVLFESFLVNKENEFILNVILPAFKYVHNFFKIKPLIVPLLPVEDENSIYWWCYPKSIKKIVNKKIEKNNPNVN